MSETTSRRTALARIAAVSVATVPAAASAAEVDPHPEWWRKATVIREWINDPEAGEREDEETDGPFAESIRLEDLIGETPAHTLAGVQTQVALVLHTLTEYSSHNDNDILALENALATLDRLQGIPNPGPGPRPPRAPVAAPMQLVHDFEDQELWQLGRALDAAWKDERAAFAARKADPNDATEAAAQAAYAACSAIVDEMEGIPARTLLGFQVKARAISWCHDGEEVDLSGLQDTTDARLAASLVNDLVAFGEVRHG